MNKKNLIAAICIVIILSSYLYVSGCGEKPTRQGSQNSGTGAGSGCPPGCICCQRFNLAVNPFKTGGERRQIDSGVAPRCMIGTTASACPGGGQQTSGGIWLPYHGCNCPDRDADGETDHYDCLPFP